MMLLIIICILNTLLNLVYCSKLRKVPLPSIDQNAIKALNKANGNINTAQVVIYILFYLIIIV
jgi:hypothetical protein